MTEGGQEAVRADDEVVPAADVRRLEDRVRELERQLGRKTLEVEILKEAIDASQLHGNGSRSSGSKGPSANAPFRLRPESGQRGIQVIIALNTSSYCRLAGRAGSGPHRHIDVPQGRLNQVDWRATVERMGRVLVLEPVG